MNKILVVDDEERIRKVLDVAFRDEGYEVLQAEDGRTGETLARSEKPDVILLDVMLPDASGFDVCRSLKSDKDLEFIPVIMLTALGETGKVVQGLDAGADDYISKPFNMMELLSRVRSHLRTKELYDATRNDEREKSALLEIAHSLSSSMDPQETLFSIVFKVAEVLEVARCSIIYVDPSTHETRVMASHDSREVQYLKLDLDKYPEIREVVETGKPVVIPDAATDPLLHPVRDIPRFPELKSLMAFPVILKDSLIGTLVLRTTRREKAFTDREIRFGGLISHLVAPPLKNAYLFKTLHMEKEQEREARRRAEDNLKESQRVLAALMSHLPGMAYRCRNDKEWTMEFVSEGVYGLTGYRPREFMEERKVKYGDLVHPEDADSVWEGVQAGIMERRPFQLTYRVKAANGQWKWVWEQGAGVFTPEGELLALEGFISDITEQKLASRRLEESEEKYRSLVENSPNCICHIDMEGKILYINPAGLLINKLKNLETAIGMDCLHNVKDEFQPMAREALERAKKGETVNLEYASVVPGRKIRWWISTLRPMSYRNGEVESILRISRDITDRKRAERRLSDVNRALRVLSEGNHALALAVDEQQLLDRMCEVIVKTGGYLFAWVGYAEEDEAKTVRPVAYQGFEEGYLENVKVTWADTEWGKGPSGTSIRTGKPCVVRNVQTDPAFKPWREEAMRRGYSSSLGLPLIAEGKRLGSLAIYGKEPDGFNEEEVRLLRNLADNLAYGIVALRRKSDQEQAVKELEKSREEAMMQGLFAQRLSALAAVSGGISHELSQPLSIIGLHAETIKAMITKGRELERDYLLENVEKTLAQVDRAVNIIDHMKEFSSGGQGCESGPLSLTRLVQSVKDLFGSQLQSHGISLRTEIPLDLSILANRNRMEQVLVNLISNARDVFMEKTLPPERAKEITIRAFREDSFALMDVSDTGPGIADSVRERLFEPFVTGKKAKKGSGLGLSICRRILHDFGAEIDLHATGEEGTTFRIRFPLKEG